MIKNGNLVVIVFVYQPSALWLAKTHRIDRGLSSCTLRRYMYAPVYKHIQITTVSSVKRRW